MFPKEYEKALICLSQEKDWGLGSDVHLMVNCVIYIQMYTKIHFIGLRQLPYSKIRVYRISRDDQNWFALNVICYIHCQFFDKVFVWE